MKTYLAIDTGGTNIKYGLLDENAEIIDQGEIPTPQDSLESFIVALEGIYNKYSDSHPEALVMSAPGKIDAVNGYFHTGGALNYLNKCDLKKSLENRIPVPFCVENDAKCAALAEIWKGSMQGVDNGIVITLGTGIGGAVIINGRLHRGSHFAAGEFSGVLTDWSSLAAMDAPTWAGINRVAAMLGRYASRKRIDPEKVDGRYFFDALNHGDPAAEKELKWYCDTMAGGLYSMQLILDASKVAIGGGISRQKALIAQLQESMKDLFERMPEWTPAEIPEITACTFASDSNLIGALYHYLYEYLPAKKDSSEKSKSE